MDFSDTAIIIIPLLVCKLWVAVLRGVIQNLQEDLM